MQRLVLIFQCKNNVKNDSLISDHMVHGCAYKRKLCFYQMFL